MKNKLLFHFLGMLLIFICFSFSEQDKECDKAKKKLTKQFSHLDHDEIYNSKDSSDKELLDIIWELSANRCALEKIINDQKINTKARFYAGEIFLEKQDFVSETEKKLLAEIYAEAINKNVFETLNYWGMYNAGDIGETGKHLLKIGEVAIPALAKVLNSEEKMHYWGGKSADVGGSWQYRAKDVAAFFIFQIKKQKFDWPKSPQERDKIITVLKDSLKK